ncbi:MAG: T9SS type A sorting domain-containing protein [Candidatus Kapabacteria bacterium]|nr:T9SS type A sorting domain-containing protein [Candidatus Kapabacteria bacterium]
MKIYIYLIVVLSSYVFGFSQQIQTKWEYYHLASKAFVDFYHGKKIAYSEIFNMVYLAVDNSDSMPNILYLKTDGLFVRRIEFDAPSPVFGPYIVKQSEMNKYYLHSNFYLNPNNPSLSLIIQFYKNNYERFSILYGGLRPKDNMMTIWGGDVKNPGFYPHTTITSHRSQGKYNLLDSISVINGDSTIIRMKVVECFNIADIEFEKDSVVSFSYSTSQFPLLPYPMAARQDDTNSYYVLHAPDTLYRGTTETAIRVTKHEKMKFELEEIYVPMQSSFMFTLPLDPNPWQKKFVPKSFAISKNGFTIVGNAIDSLGKSAPLIHYSRFDKSITSTIIGTVEADLNGCRVRDDGTVVAVGTKPNGIMGTNDYYLAIVKPSGIDRLQEFTWGGAFDDALADVTFVDNGDIVVSGNAGVNCYVARIATDNPTSVGENVPFSASIGFAPNPASSQTLVRFAPTTDGIATAELFDMRGMKVKQLFSEPVQRGNEYTFPAPVSDVPNGVYTVIITNGITKHHQQLQIIR